MRYTISMDNEHTYDKANAACGETGPYAPSLFGSWTGPAIGLLDLDAFFASVEQLDHPDWRGKPVIVGGSPDRRGVVSTASYEARTFGVHSAMPSAQAKRLCPHAIWTDGNFSRYRELSARVMAILADETPYVDQVSIDEAFFDISPGRFNSESPLAVVRRISERVNALGITCSIGLGCNKTVAKIASERDKPRGLTAILPGTEEAFLAPLPVRTMSGIGARAEQALAQRGIHTLGQLAGAPDDILAPVFGANTASVRQRAQGRERSRVHAIDEASPMKSLSNERTFAHDLTEQADIEAAIDVLGESVGRRLRKRRLTGRTVTLKLKYGYGSGRTAQRTLEAPTDDEHIFCRAARELLHTIWSPGVAVRLVGVCMSGFDHESGVQTNLFCELDERGAASSEKRALSVAVDGVIERFGSSAVGYGRSMRFDHDVVRRDKYS